MRRTKRPRARSCPAKPPPRTGATAAAVFVVPTCAANTAVVVVLVAVVVLVVVVVVVVVVAVAAAPPSAVRTHMGRPAVPAAAYSCHYCPFATTPSVRRKCSSVILYFYRCARVRSKRTTRPPRSATRANRLPTAYIGCLIIGCSTLSAPRSNGRVWLHSFEGWSRFDFSSVVIIIIARVFFPFYGRLKSRLSGRKRSGGGQILFE